MKTILLFLAVFAFLSGFGILGFAKSAIHEIEAFVLYIVSAVLFSGSAIVGAINSLTEKLEKAPPETKLLSSLQPVEKKLNDVEDNGKANSKNKENELLNRENRIIARLQKELNREPTENEIQKAKWDGLES